MSENDVINILNLYYYNNKSIKNISLLYNNISYDSIENITSRKNWKHISFKIPNNFIPKYDNIGENHKNSKLTEFQVNCIRLKRKFLKTKIKELTKEFNINRKHVYSILNYRKWKHVQIPDIYDFYIGNNHIIAFINKIININNIEYKFIGRILDNNILPNINCIYIR